MVKSFELSKNNVFYYDLEAKTIARHPSNSNLKASGSDNSLYFGLSTNEEICKIICKLLDVKRIKDINGLCFDMSAYNGFVGVVININAYGQIQIKIQKDGSMYEIANRYRFEIMNNVDCTKELLVIDFKNREIRFIADFKL